MSLTVEARVGLGCWAGVETQHIDAAVGGGDVLEQSNNVDPALDP